MFTPTYMHTDYVEVILNYVEVNLNTQIREYSLASFYILFLIKSLMLSFCRNNMETILFVRALYIKFAKFYQRQKVSAITYCICAEENTLHNQIDFED